LPPHKQIGLGPGACKRPTPGRELVKVKRKKRARA